MTHSTIQNPRPTTTSRPSTQAHAKQTQAQIGAQTVNPSPRRANPHPDQRRDHQPKPRSAPRPSTQAHAEQTQAISFFFAMENRGRAQGREGKKNGREKKIEQNERERKKKKKA